MGEERKTSREVPDFMSQLIQDERRAAEAYRQRAAEVDEAALRTLLLRLSDMRALQCKELESFVREADGSAIITRQINDMFL
jgi:hypothetical protein